MYLSEPFYTRAPAGCGCDHERPLENAGRLGSRLSNPKGFHMKVVGSMVLISVMVALAAHSPTAREVRLVDGGEDQAPTAAAYQDIYAESGKPASIDQARRPN